jgi:hypothetical protein
LDFVYWMGSIGTRTAVDEGMLRVVGTMISSVDDSGPGLCIAEELGEYTGRKVDDVVGTQGGGESGTLVGSVGASGLGVRILVLYGTDNGAGPGSPGPYCSQLAVLEVLPSLDRALHFAVFDASVVVALVVPWTPDVGAGYTVVYSIMYTHSISGWLLGFRLEGETDGNAIVLEVCAAASTVVCAP